MAFLKGSRYATLDRFAAPSTFKGVKPRLIPRATPVLEYTMSMKDRLDALAQNYYRNSRAWVRLSEANPQELFAEDLIWTSDPVAENGREKLGEVVLVPRREEERG